jgi:hypothetical protein
MKIELQYVSDDKGNPKSVQLPISDWNKLMNKIKTYEQSLQMKNDLSEAYAEVAILKKSKHKKSTLTEFLDEL